MLSDRAMIANLTIKTWAAKKYDDKITEDITTNKGIRKSVIRATKVLLPNDPQLKRIKQARQNLRGYHYEHTLPWEWKTTQLLPGEFFMEYTKTIATLISDFEREVDAFCDPVYYNNAIQAASIELKDTFCHQDYPLPGQIRDHFTASIAYSPVPSAGDFRVDIQAEEIADLKAAWTIKEGDITRKCTEHLWTKLHNMMEHAQERLSDPKNVFHDTLPANIKDFTDILSKMNIGEDFDLDAIGKEAATIGGLEPQDLRDDPGLRRAAANTSQSVLDKIKKQMGAFNA